MLAPADPAGPRALDRPAPRRRGRVPFADGLRSFGDAVALVAEGRAVGYAELADRVDERAAALGDARRLVMIAGGNDVETLVTYLGALRGGHVAWLVPDACSGGSAALASAFAPDVVVSTGGEGTVIEERRRGSAHALHPDLALLLGTSGSTGAPRLVRLSHENLASNAEAIATYLGITADERAVTSLPIHYCYGLSVVNSHLLRGARLLLTGRSVSDPGFWDLVRDEGGTSFAGVPHTFDLLDRVGFPDMDLPTLRCVTQAGGRMDPERVRRYAELGAERGWRLVVMYGQTEATARIAYLPAHLAARCPEAIGVPIPGGAIEIREEPGAGGDGMGEIVYRGPNVMLGYARGPEDLALGRVVHELRTGDLGRRRPDGLHEIVGRRSRFLKLFGLRVDLDEVERIAGRMGATAACAGTDERLVVAVEGEAPPGLAGTLARRLGVPAGSVAVRTVEAIPRLPNGKRDHAAVAAMAEGGGAGAGKEPEGAPEGEGVADIFRRVLDRDRVGDDDTFSGLGGDSLSYVETSLALEETLGHVPAGWPEMRVRDLQALARPRRRGARLETGVALRAAAIVLVVASHMTAFWPAGGAHLLLGLAGHSFARFQLPATDAPRRLARWAGTVARVAVPSSAWIGLQVLLAGGYSLGAVLLVNNYLGAPERGSDGRWHYWFVEALVQILVVLGVLFSVPAVRRLERSRPFAFVLVLLGTALTVRYDLVTLGDDHNLIFRPHAVAWIFLLGWLAHRARTPAQRAVTSALVVACVPGFFGDPVREAIIAGGLLLALWVPAVVVPRPAVRVIGPVAAASLYIYLTHWQVWPALGEVLPAALVLPATVAAGVGTWLVAERLTALGRRAWSSARGGGGRPAPVAGWAADPSAPGSRP